MIDYQAPPKSPAHFDREAQSAFWHFIYARQNIFVRRLHGVPPPWTGDEVLSTHKFTNMYRASDRVSQFLLKHVLFTPHAFHTLEEQAFRAVLFRIFNEPAAYEAIVAGLHTHPTQANFNVALYTRFLDDAIAAGTRIWGGAYMITPPHSTYDGSRSKHQAWLEILDRMCYAATFDQIRSYYDINRLTLAGMYADFLRFETVGKFFAFQWTIDVNYAVQLSENSFVIAGPGAVRGLKKLGMLDSLSPEEAIYWLTRNQDDLFDEYGLRFPYLGNHRRLHLIDIQNACCEWDKWTRVAMPQYQRRVGTSGYVRIKTSFDPTQAYRTHPPIDYVYPPSWNIPVTW